jgi:hypothetical protein
VGCCGKWLARRACHGGPRGLGLESEGAVAGVGELVWVAAAGGPLGVRA